MGNSNLHVVDKQPEPPAVSSSGDERGDSFGERLARLETHVEYLATKEDISEVRVLIERKLNRILYCIIGIMVISITALAIALIRIW